MHIESILESTRWLQSSCMTVTRRRQSHVILSKDTIDGHKQQIYLDDQNATISEDTDYTYLVHDAMFGFQQFYFNIVVVRVAKERR